MRNALRRGSLLVAAALVVSLPAITPAQADPTFVPDSNDIVGVGSDTTEFVMQALAARFNKNAVGGTRRMASWNATNPNTGQVGDTIQVRRGTSITRPNGSSAGIAELLNDPAVSFARSSRGPNSTGDTGTVFYPYAKDRLGYVFTKTPTSNVKKLMTAADLQDIYTCTKTNWRQFSRPAGQIHAYIPQTGSGTYKFFIGSIGVTDTQIANAVAQDDRVCNVQYAQEHDPSAVLNDPQPVVASHPENAVEPFSFARYKTLPPATKQQLGYAVNAPFNVVRDVYNVIRTSDATSGENLSQFFDDTSWICTSQSALDAINLKGFTRLPSGQCGVPVVAP